MNVPHCWEPSGAPIATAMDVHQRRVTADLRDAPDQAEGALGPSVPAHDLRVPIRMESASFPPARYCTAMSEENVETVRRVYEGVNARLEAPRELFDPGYEFDNTELWPDVVEVLGFEAAQEAMREYWETFEAYHVEIEEVIYADEGRVVDVVRDGGRMRGTDAEVWNRFFHVWTLRDGRIVRLSIHTDRNRSLEAAGLSE